MGADSKIAWTRHTFNPWIGCQHVSPGCDHCYAERMAKRFGWPEWGPHAPRRRTSVRNWQQPLKWNAIAEGMRRRDRVFCASMADWLDNAVPQEWRRDLAVLIGQTPNLDWLLLTKRIENFDSLSPWPPGAVPQNVWLGVTCENQEMYDRRWPILAKIHAFVRFVSYEPALDQIETLSNGILETPDWIIMGGESGPGARPMPEGWAYWMRDLCLCRGIPLFMKQMQGGKEPPPELFIRQFPTPRRL